MSHDEFISYSSKDKTIADAVCARLWSEKICFWITSIDSGGVLATDPLRSRLCYSVIAIA